MMNRVKSFLIALFLFSCAGDNPTLPILSTDKFTISDFRNSVLFDSLNMYLENEFIDSTGNIKTKYYSSHTFSITRIIIIQDTRLTNVSEFRWSLKLPLGASIPHADRKYILFQLNSLFGVSGDDFDLAWTNIDIVQDEPDVLIKFNNSFIFARAHLNKQPPYSGSRKEVVIRQ